MTKKKIISTILAFCMFIGLAFNSEIVNASISTNPIYCKYTNTSFTHNPKFANEVLFTGIDVSVYDGVIDWKKVKADGIDFAFIRCGYRSTGDGHIGKDSRFDYNIKNALKEGLQVGVYFFSQATTVDEAVEEANAALAYISDYYFSLPIVIDFEHRDDRSDRLAQANLTKQQGTDIINAFASTIRNANFIPMLYANPSMLNGELLPDQIGCKLWLANWTSKTSYAGNYEFWQCSGDAKDGTKAHVDGIDVVVDLDFWYSNSNYVFEGIDYSPVFCAREYLEIYPDLRAAFGNDEVAAFHHFLTSGMAEGRRGNYSFDAFSYRGRYADLRNAFGRDMTMYYKHYLFSGRREGRNGSNANKDCGVFVVNSDNTIAHYVVRYGQWIDLPTLTKKGAEFAGWDNNCEAVTSSMTVTAQWKYIYDGVDYSKVFNLEYYLGLYPDLRNAFGNDGELALKHFVLNGMAEGRQAIENFNAYSYRGRYWDLQKAFGNDMRLYYIHYMNSGYKEGRNGQYNGSVYTVNFYNDGSLVSSQRVAYGHSAVIPNVNKLGATFAGWDNNKYSVVTSDVTTNATWKYINSGIDYSSVFDATYYLNRYADLKAAFGDNTAMALEHFLVCGMREGRQGKADFDVFSYKGRYIDLQNAFGDDLKAYYTHYISCGQREGRNATPNEQYYTVTFMDGENVLKTEYVKYGHVATAPRVGNNADLYLTWDSSSYKCVTSDLIVNAVYRYVYKGVDYSAVFNPEFYLNRYGDLRAAFGSDVYRALEHFAVCGVNEGRQGRDIFNVHAYKNRYSDLRNAFGDNMSQYYLHYIYYGKRENRIAY